MSAISTVVERARAAGRRVLLEPEGRRLLAQLGLPVPRQLLARDPERAKKVATLACDRFSSDRVVVKIVAPGIQHKTDVGGIEVVAKNPGAIAAVIAAMAERFRGTDVAGYSVNEFVTYDPSPGGELLLGMRWTDEFGPVVTLALGGVATELLAAELRPGHGVVVLPAGDTDHDGVGARIAGKIIAPLVTGGIRGRPPRISTETLDELLSRFLAFAGRNLPDPISELEVNPVALTVDGPVALDVAVSLGGPAPAPPPPRPLPKLARLLAPRSVAIVGVSRRLNAGHIIVNNLLREGIDRRRIYVIKPDADQIEGCRCCPEVGSLPERVDLAVLAVDAEQVPEVVDQIIDHQKAESLLVIPGGLGERRGTEGLARRVSERIIASRDTGWGGPVVNGGNCLGIRAAPGRHDTMFLSRYKLPARGEPAPLALISQSGAFLASKESKLAALTPRYLISVGNQIDLTLGDYIEHLAEDSGIEVFAFYVEGFRRLDGRRWLRAAREITAAGRPVILYRAGRTREGVRATASHTAAIAGDYAVARELASGAGVVVADTIADFEDLVRLFCQLRGKRVGGLRLGAVSNAGFECVGIADNSEGFELAEFGNETTARIEEALDSAGVDRIVAVQNPVDLTPMTTDEHFAAVVRAVLDDPAVDVGVCGVVPMTPALQTLPAGPGHREDIASERSVAGHLIRLLATHQKAWVAIVDAGPLYEPLVQLLEHAGVPVFRTADRALRLFDRFCAWRRRHGDSA